nr:hypothetical protein [Enterococcus innesii]
MQDNKLHQHLKKSFASMHHDQRYSAFSTMRMAAYEQRTVTLCYVSTTFIL